MAFAVRTLATGLVRFKKRSPPLLSSGQKFEKDENKENLYFVISLFQKIQYSHFVKFDSGVVLSKVNMIFEKVKLVVKICF